MATKTQVLLIDDITGEPADKTVTFGLDSVTYELDLSEKSEYEMRQALAPYLNAARKVSSGKRTAAAKRAFSGVDGAAVRAWAKGQGIEVSGRGRIKAEIVEQYRAAGN